MVFSTNFAVDAKVWKIISLEIYQTWVFVAVALTVTFNNKWVFQVFELS